MKTFLGRDFGKMCCLSAPACTAATHGALGREEPGARVASRLALEPGVELSPAGLVDGAAHAPDEGEQEQRLHVGYQGLDRLFFRRRRTSLYLVYSCMQELLSRQSGE